MENRIAVVNIIVENRESAGAVNVLLHEYGNYIIGRLGIPYSGKNISVICVVLDAPPALVSALAGKLGMIPGLTIKTVTAKA